MESEVVYNKKYRYIPPHKRKKPKEYEGVQIEEVLLCIYYKVEEL